ncbi:MAG: hypothetical protein EON58_15975 [Alphaproteobacteria bacterium]|nr:MAG: hypothetical protein EON58_15975 [Alphaproteobacteria bacterium]
MCAIHSAGSPLIPQEDRLDRHSSNATLRSDNPEDQGVAVWFTGKECRSKGPPHRVSGMIQFDEVGFVFLPVTRVYIWAIHLASEELLAAGRNSGKTA